MARSLASLKNACPSPMKRWLGAASKGGDGGSGMRAKILIVEDEPEIVRVLKAALTKAGFEVITASDGRRPREGLWVLWGAEKLRLLMLEAGGPADKPSLYKTCKR